MHVTPGCSRKLFPLLSAALLFSPGCGAPAVNLAQQRTDALRAIEALRAGKFDRAATAAEEVASRSPENAYARLVRAVTRYKKAMHQLSTDVRTVAFGAVAARGFNHRYMRSSLTQAEEELAAVERDLAAVAAHPDLSVELCLACWEVDWNHNGRIDRMDRWLFQIERDAEGRRIPPDDPRRKPTFRFDHGDVYWARAFVSFQRAALDVLLAYRWTEIDRVFQLARGQRATITIRMEKPELVAEARRRILEGLSFADRTREAYLAEKDDDREWVPNPRQKSHPLPLPVDDRLYETWEAVVGDLRRLVEGKEGLSVEKVAQLGDHRWEHPPKGFIDVGRMLSRPKDIVLRIDDLKRLESAADVERALKSVLGEYYVRRMRASPITSRLDRMKREVQRGEETLERKLRYLFWLN
jgi:hypothetical protein